MASRGSASLPSTPAALPSIACCSAVPNPRKAIVVARVGAQRRPNASSSAAERLPRGRLLMRRPKDYWHAAAIEAADQWNVRILGPQRAPRTAAPACRPTSDTSEYLARQSGSSPHGARETTTCRTPPRSGCEWDNDERASTRRPFRRLVWGDVSTFEIAQSLRPRSYLSHGSAMVLNGLVDT